MPYLKSAVLPRLKNLLQNLTLAVASSLLAFSVLESAARLHGPEPLLGFTDYRGQTLDIYRLGLPVQYDSLLGWIPRQGFASTQNRWGTRVTILEHGIRSNGPGSDSVAPIRPILTVGDSFTFGDEVSDDETWPAALQHRLGRQVINAGVFAYGVDQSFLRLRNLLSVYEPSLVVLSFIPEDIPRTEYAVALGSAKPYFAVAGDSLLLRNVPTPTPTASRRPRILSQVLGHSYLVHRLMMRIAPSWWLQGGYRWSEGPTGYDGVTITCLIFQRLEQIAREQSIQVYVLVQDKKTSSLTHPPIAAMVDSVLSCLDREVVHVIDVRPALRAVAERDPESYKSLFINHMTRAGNAFVAEQVAQAVDRTDE